MFRTITAHLMSKHYTIKEQRMMGWARVEEALVKEDDMEIIRIGRYFARLREIEVKYIDKNLPTIKA